MWSVSWSTNWANATNNEVKLGSSIVVSGILMVVEICLAEGKGPLTPLLLGSENPSSKAGSKILFNGVNDFPKRGWRRLLHSPSIVLNGSLGLQLGFSSKGHFKGAFLNYVDKIGWVYVS